MIRGAIIIKKVIMAVLVLPKAKFKRWCKWLLSALNGFLFDIIRVKNNLTESTTGINVNKIISSELIIDLL